MISDFSIRIHIVTRIMALTFTNPWKFVPLLSSVSFLYPAGWNHLILKDKNLPATNVHFCYQVTKVGSRVSISLNHQRPRLLR